jgi:3-deoxy-D-manno-octulosonic-acid transferase
MFFVQNQASAKLVENIGINHFEITGDTRFDRVADIAENPKQLNDIGSFKGKSSCMVVGSSWPEDIKVLLPLIHEKRGEMKFIIAPHEIEEKGIQKLTEMIGEGCVRYSQLVRSPNNEHVLIIDSIGHLSSVYQFADMAFIGGAYGKGLHNILEAAIFRIPVFFGNLNYTKFQEAIDLIGINAAFPVVDSDELIRKVNDFTNDPEKQEATRLKLDKYIESNLGASRKIIKYCEELL